MWMAKNNKNEFKLICYANRLFYLKSSSYAIVCYDNFMSIKIIYLTQTWQQYHLISSVASMYATLESKHI